MAAKKEEVELTTSGSHRATERGYDGNEVVEPGDIVTPGIPVGSWMEPAGKAE